MKKLVLATQNRDKFREMEQALKDTGWELLPAFDLPGAPDVIEDGLTIEENSFKKADALCLFSGEAALADDTGLFVDALDGAPGVFAARYAGEGCTYSDNVHKLLESMKDIPDAQRVAFFRTVITIRYPNGAVDQVLGEVKGLIGKAPQGHGGFGYDPIFKPEGSDRVFAEMTLSEKNAVSHRGRALQKAAVTLRGKR